MAISSSESDWAWLSKDLLVSIMDKVASPFDKVRFGAVCKSWQSVARDCAKTPLGTQPPMLLIPNKDGIKKARSLYSVTERKIYDFKIPMPYNRRCCGSSFGWLSVETSTPDITLFNPFRNAKIHLPPLLKLGGECTHFQYSNTYQYCVAKVTLSSAPTSTPPGDCLVVAIYGVHNRLAFMKLDEASWTCVDERHRLLFSDVLCVKGQVVALDHRGGLVSVGINSNQVKTLAPRDMEYAIQAYLVETSSGDLLMVRKFLEDREDDGRQSMTVCFDVYKLVVEDESGEVVERIKVKNIGNQALFLGDNHSISVSASDFPGCQPNCIYYTDDYIDTNPYYPNGPIDMGIFNLEDGSIRPHYKPNRSHKHSPPPIWINLPIDVAGQEIEFEQSCTNQY